LLPWQLWLSAVGVNGPEPGRGALFTDLGILLEAAASGLGVALCLARVAEPFIARGQLVPLFDQAVPSPHTYHALVDAETAQRPEVTAFTDWLKTSLA
jgi:DNA-binding transcriptional LysR family regulator